MKKIITLVQLIVGFLVLLFAIVVFLKATIALIPGVNVAFIQNLPGNISGVSDIVRLVFSIFLVQVVAVYTKNLFDKLSVSE